MTAVGRRKRPEATAAADGRMKHGRGRREVARSLNGDEEMRVMFYY